MKRYLSTAPMLCAAFILASLIPASPAWAVQTFTVNSTLDQVDDDLSDGLCHTAANLCTLRAAVMQANRSPNTGATIILSADTYLLTRPPAGADGEDTGDLNFTKPVSGNPPIKIVGAGSDATFIDAGGIDRVISIASGRSLSISDVTIRNGDTSALGGGIYLKGVLDLTRCVVSGNRAGSGGGLFTETEATATIVKSHFTGNVSSMGGNGGGIFQDGNLTLHESTLDANIAGEEGGGIFNSRNFVMVASTVSGNTAVGGVGGGIVNYGNLLASNSTISDNRAYSGGAGIANLTVANVYNLTIVFNQSDYTGQNGDAGATGGINNYDVYGGVFNLRNTLVAGNFDGGSPAPHDCAGTLNAYGRNLIGVAGDIVSCAIVVKSGSWTNLNSLNYLGTLRNNGGATATHALLPGSNAINGGDPVFGCTDQSGNTIPFDQRGYARAIGVCDIGAFEFDPGRIFFNGFD